MGWNSPDQVMANSSGQEGPCVQASVTKLGLLPLLDIALTNKRQGERARLTSYSWPMVALVGGMVLLTKKNRASSGLRWIRFRIKK